MSIDFEGFRLRLEGKEIKDSIFIASPKGEYQIIPLSRQESNNSVTDTFVREDIGVLDIDGTRIGTETKLNSSKPKAERSVFTGGFIGGTETKVLNHGRFPSNFILQHDADCSRDGTKQVKGSHLDHFGGSSKLNKIYGSMIRMAQKGHTDENGMEQVANWICTETCPVRELDSQSGVLQSGQVLDHYRRNSSTQPSGGGYEGGFKDTFLTGYGDKGGASRFFKQVESTEELDRYLQTLTRT